MGACCSQDSTPVTSKSLKAWSRVYTRLLGALLRTHSHSLWYQDTCAVAAAWDSSPASSLVFQNRWRSLGALDEKSPRLSYYPGTQKGKNLFEMMSDDFGDKSTPIGTLISVFSDSYLAEFASVNTQIVSTRNQAQADMQLQAICTLLLQFTQVLKSTSLVLYNEVAMSLARKKQDLEDLLLTHILSGDIGRLVEDLAVVVKGEWGGGGETNKEKSEMSEIVAKYLMEYAETSNFALRHKLLLDISERLSETSDSLDTHTDALGQVWNLCSIPRLPGLLYASKLLLVDQPICLSSLLSSLPNI